MPSAKGIEEGFARAKTERQNYESTLQDIWDFYFPGRRSWYGDAVGERRDEHIFDETAVVTGEEFANRFQSASCPTWSQWMRLEPGWAVTDEEDRIASQRLLDLITNKFFERLWGSNFPIEINEVFNDLIPGTALLEMEDGLDGWEFMVERPPGFWILAGANGKIYWIFRKRMVTKDDFRTLWPMAAYDEQWWSGANTPESGGNPLTTSKGKIPVIESMWLDRANLGTETWDYDVVIEGKDTKALNRTYAGEGAMPWKVPRYSRISGESYGRGVGWKTLSAVKTLNLTMQLIFENAEMQIAGMWQLENDGSVNTDNIRFEPGTVLSYSPDSQGYTPLTPGGNFDVANIILQDQRHNVRRGMHADTLGPRAGTPASAEEVAQRTADQSELMGPVLDRQFIELLLPIVRRGMFLLRRDGEIEMPRIDGRLIQMRLLSPLAQARQMIKVRNMDNFAAQVAGRYGPQALQSVHDSSKAARHLADWWDVPADTVFTPEQERQNAQAMGAAAAEAEAAGADLAGALGA